MLRSKTLLFLAVMLVMTLIGLPARAQKNRSIVNDASTIIEILQRDYTLTDNITTRLKLIQGDRKKVISIFRAYTLQAKDSTFKSEESVPDISEHQANILNKLSTSSVVRNEYNSIEKKLYAYDSKIIADLFNYFKAKESKNLLLSDVLQKLKDKFAAVNGKTFDVSGNSIGVGEVEKGLSAAMGGGLTFTNAIDGLATFMAKRIKQELATQLFDHIQRELSTSNPDFYKYEELKVLLPKTFFLVTTVKPYEYQGFINSLKESIETDLRSTFENLPNLQYTTRMQNLISKHPDLVMVFDGLRLIHDLNKSRSAIEVVFTLENSSMVSRWQSDPRYADLANGIKLASLLTYAASIPTPTARQFVSVNSWESYMSNVDFNKLFFGFLVQQDLNYFKIEFNNKSMGRSVLASTELASTYFDEFDHRIRQLAVLSSALEEEASGIRRMLLENRKVSHDTISDFLDNSLTLLDSIFSFTDFAAVSLTQTDLNFRPKASIYISFGRSAIDVYTELGNKNYFNAMLEGLSLAEKAKVNAKSANIEAVLSKYSAYTSLQRAINNLPLAEKVTENIYDRAVSLAKELNDCGCSNTSEIAALTLEEAQQPAGRLKIQNFISKISTDSCGGFFFCVFEKTFQRKLKETGFSWADYPNVKSALMKVKGKSSAEVISVFVSARRDLINQPYMANDPDLVRLLNFFMNVSKAKTAEDFEGAVEAIVLPAGSAIIKRESKVNLAINSFPGFFFGREYIHDLSNSDENSFAVTVPIGIAFSTSLSKGRRPASLTFFASAIDIGAFTSVRFKSDDAPLPEITFKNILAPGAHLILGLPKSPFAIGVNAQYGPMLREVKIMTDQNGNALPEPVMDERSAYRFGISILMDIPLLNIYTKSKTLSSCN